MGIIEGYTKSKNDIQMGIGDVGVKGKNDISYILDRPYERARPIETIRTGGDVGPTRMIKIGGYTPVHIEENWKGNC